MKFRSTLLLLARRRVAPGHRPSQPSFPIVSRVFTRSLDLPTGQRTRTCARAHTHRRPFASGLLISMFNSHKAASHPKKFH